MVEDFYGTIQNIQAESREVSDFANLAGQIRIRPHC